MEILSDTGGIDFGPYLKLLHVYVQQHWEPLIPEVALPPMMKSGMVTIEFAIMKDGYIRGLKLLHSSGDASLDRAAWGAITSSTPLPALPADFSHEFLLLRCSFYYNPSPPEKAATENRLPTYNQGVTEIQRGHWSDAERLMRETVEAEPDFAAAWDDLGRAQMYLHKYSDAEASFRKLLSLKPFESHPYLQLAWSLASEKKYAEAARLLEDRIVGAPEDGAALRRLGYVYVLMQQAERAVPVLEKASHLNPNDEFVYYDLGLAYLKVHRNDDAVSAFERSMAIKTSDSKLNSAAYQLAKSKTHLDLGETWARSAVNQVENELNQVTLAIAQPKASALLRNCSMYWDTLGWVKFQQGDLTTAERYIRAGWELADDTTIGYHLGRVYESQGHRNQAIEVYAQVLGGGPATGEMTDDEKDARSRLAALLGSESLVDARVNESRERLKDRRSVQLDNPAGVDGTTEYVVMLGPAGKLIDLRRTNGDSQSDKLATTIRSAALPQSLPDAVILKLPGSGKLVCRGTSQPCRFTLLSAEDAARSSPNPRTEP